MLVVTSRPCVGADLKGIHFRRFGMGRLAGGEFGTHPCTGFQVKATSLDFYFSPCDVDLYLMSDPPAPFAGGGVVEHRKCLAPIATSLVGLF